MRFGAVFGCCKPYGAVRCCDISYGAVRFGFQKSGMLRCRSVWFSDAVNPTVRFGYISCPKVRFGAVFQHRKTYGAVRFGFEEGKNPSVRFGAAPNRIEPHRTAPNRYEKSHRKIPWIFWACYILRPNAFFTSIGKKDVSTIGVYGCLTLKCK